VFFIVFDFAVLQRHLTPPQIVLKVLWLMLNPHPDPLPSGERELILGELLHTTDSLMQQIVSVNVLGASVSPHPNPLPSGERE
jgi:hypothetical protein